MTILELNENEIRILVNMINNIDENTTDYINNKNLKIVSDVLRNKIKAISQLSRLKDCPFCRNNFYNLEIADTYEHNYYIKCNNCKACGPDALTEEEAMKSWGIEE